MNEDKIEIIGSFVDSKHCDQTLVLSVEIKINGTPIKWSYIDLFSIASNWKNHKSKRFPELMGSVFEPFSCSCGVAGCAGIWDGIHVKMRKHSVEWRAKRSNGYKFLPKQFFSFERRQYEKARRSFFGWLRMQSDFDYYLCVDNYGEGESPVSLEQFMNDIDAAYCD